MAFIKKYDNGETKRILIQDKQDNRYIIFHADRTYSIFKYNWLNMKDIYENSYCVSMCEVLKIKEGIEKFINDKIEEGNKQLSKYDMMYNMDERNKIKDVQKWDNYILKVLSRIK